MSLATLSQARYNPGCLSKITVLFISEVYKILSLSIMESAVL
jgi:hypothetical protein